MPPRCAIVGGGVGGLTAALCFAAEGWHVAVFERASRFSDIGAGLQLSPNAVRVLHRLGLAKELHAVASAPPDTRIRHWRSGQTIATLPLGEAVEARYGFPYYHVHRAGLVAVLAAAAADRGIALHTNAEAVRIDASATLAVEAAGRRHDAELLVGADGIHSTVRALCFAADRPRFTGNVAWRGLIPAASAPPAARSSACLWWGPGRHVVHYPLTAAAATSPTWVNCVAVVEQNAPWLEESWTAKGDGGELRRAFAAWHAQVRSLIAAIPAEQCYRWALFDRPTLRRWCRGRVALLGDACHPLLPFLAQGAALAIEDAAVLARCVAMGDVAAGLRRYQQLRQSRVAWVGGAARRNARVFHMRGVSAWLRNRFAAAAATRTFDRLFRYDAYRQ